MSGFEAVLSDKKEPTATLIEHLLLNNTDADNEEIPASYHGVNDEEEEYLLTAYDNANLTASDNTTLAELWGDHRFTEFPFEEPKVNKSAALGAAWLEDSFNTVIGFGGTIMGEIFFIQQSPRSTKTRIYGWAKNLRRHSFYQLTIGKYGDLQSNHSCDVAQIYHIGSNKSHYTNIPMTSNGSGIGLIDEYTNYAPLYGKYSVVGRMLLIRRVVLDRYLIQPQRNETGGLKPDEFDFHFTLRNGGYVHARQLVSVACGVIGIANDFNVTGPNNEFFEENGGAQPLAAHYLTVLIILPLCVFISFSI
uniref:Uncharacterized protein n=1 Tax=Plectus sambesii TaxID=2011161 RepID=A0A914VAV2_9BILA